MKEQGNIYLITNKITGEKYVGQTKNSIYVRFGSHCHDYKRFPYRPLYANMEKYGIDNFEPSLLETCDIDKMDEREIYWIDKLDTFENGLNDTPGGSGRSQSTWITKDIELDIVNIFEKDGYTKNIYKKYPKLTTDALSKIFAKYQIKTSSSETLQAQYGNKVQRVDIDTGEILEEYPSQIEAGYWLLKNHHTIVTNPKKLSYIIGRACRDGSVLGGYLWLRKKGEAMHTNIEEIIDRDTLKSLIRTTPFTTIAKKYEVSDNSIRRWCKKYGLPSTKREIQKYSDEEWEKL